MSADPISTADIRINPIQDFRLNLDPLDSLRGISSIIIVIGHFFTFFSPLYKTDEYPIFGLEYLSIVSLFFIISGFTLVQVYYPKDINDCIVVKQTRSNLTSTYTSISTDELNSEEELLIIKPFPDWSSRKIFLIKRLSRLFAMYYIGLIIGLGPLIIYFPLTEIISNLIVELFVLQSVYPLLNLDSPLWTVSAFMICYIIFPFLFNRLINRSDKFLFRLAFWMETIGIISVIIFTFFIPTLILVLHTNVLFRFPQFIIGVCFGILSRRNTFGFENEQSRTDKLSCFVISSFIACFLLTAFTFGEERVVRFFNYSYYAEFVLPLFYGYWIMYLTRPDSAGSISARILSVSILRELGEYSYSLYCLHFPLFFYFSWTVATNPSGISYDALPIKIWSFNIPGYWNFAPWAIIPILAILIIISAATFYYIEDPVRKFINNYYLNYDTIANNSVLLNINNTEDIITF